jgi:26S proteasome non-ATPase regulatory subunit 9
MDDIHAPTVSSGPTSGGYTNGVPKAQLSLQELMAEKDRVEAELKALGQVLDSHGVHMNTGLTTFDGFPRSDIDVPQSTHRHRRPRTVQCLMLTANQYARLERA